MSQRDVAAVMDWSASKLIRIESGQVNISTNDLRALLTLYGIDTDRISSFVGVARAARKPPPWSIYRNVASPEYLAFLGLESSASVIRNFESIYIPELLQTEDYARTLISMVEGENPEQIDPLVKLRMLRQEILERDSAPNMHFIMDEAVVHRVAGSRDIMRRQLRRIYRLAEEGRVTVRIVPYGLGLYPDQRTSYVLLEFPDPEDGDILYARSSRGDYLIREGLSEEQGLESPVAFLGSFWELEQSVSRDHALSLLEEAINLTEGEPLHRPYSAKAASGPLGAGAPGSGSGSFQRNLESGKSRLPIAGEQGPGKESPMQATLPITIYLSDESYHEGVEAAVVNLVVAAGGQIEHLDPVLGSWFRSMRAKVNKFMDSPLGDEMKNFATHAAESHLVHAQDATVTATMLQNLGPVLAALQPTKEAVIRAGALLIVKTDSTLVVHQLTVAQQLRLDYQPQLAKSPYEILSALEPRPGRPTQPSPAAPKLPRHTTPLISRFLQRQRGSQLTEIPRSAQAPNRNAHQTIPRQPNLYSMRTPRLHSLSPTHNTQGTRCVGVLTPRASCRGSCCDTQHGRHRSIHSRHHLPNQLIGQLPLATRRGPARPP